MPRDLPAAYDLLPGEYGRGRAARLGALQFSAGVVSFCWCLNRRLPRLSHHNVFLSGMSLRQYPAPLKCTTTASRLRVKSSAPFLSLCLLRTVSGGVLPSQSFNASVQALNTQSSSEFFQHFIYILEKVGDTYGNSATPVLPANYLVCRQTLGMQCRPASQVPGEVISSVPSSNFFAPAILSSDGLHEAQTTSSAHGSVRRMPLICWSAQTSTCMRPPGRTKLLRPRAATPSWSSCRWPTYRRLRQRAAMVRHAWLSAQSDALVVIKLALLSVISALLSDRVGNPTLLCQMR